MSDEAHMLGDFRIGGIFENISHIAGLGKSSTYTVGDSATGAAVSAETQSPPTLQSLENSLDLPSARNADSGTASADWLAIREMFREMMALASVSTQENR